MPTAEPADKMEAAETAHLAARAVVLARPERVGGPTADLERALTTQSGLVIDLLSSLSAVLKHVQRLETLVAYEDLRSEESPVLQGLRTIVSDLGTTLAANGVAAFGATVGELFDEERHVRAARAGVTPTDDALDDLIVRDLVRPGYLHAATGAVLIPASVHASAAVASATTTATPQGTSETPRGTRVHEVSASDTVQGLSVRYGITPAALLRLNRLPNPHAIHARQVLRLPPSAPTAGGMPSAVVAASPGPATAEGTADSVRFFVRHDEVRVGDSGRGEAGAALVGEGRPSSASLAARIAARRQARSRDGSGSHRDGRTPRSLGEGGDARAAAAGALDAANAVPNSSLVLQLESALRTALARAPSEPPAAATAAATAAVAIDVKTDEILATFGASNPTAACALLAPPDGDGSVAVDGGVGGGGGGGAMRWLHDHAARAVLEAVSTALLRPWRTVADSDGRATESGDCGGEGSHGSEAAGAFGKSVGSVVGGGGALRGHGGDGDARRAGELRYLRALAEHASEAAVHALVECEGALARDVARALWSAMRALAVPSGSSGTGRVAEEMLPRAASPLVVASSNLCHREGSRAAYGSYACDTYG